MKILLIFVLLLYSMAGCGTQVVYETIGNSCEEPQPVAQPCELQLRLPEGTVMETMDADGSGYYTLGQWEIWTRVLPGGDLHQTLQTIAPVDPDGLTLIKREINGYECVETTWSAAGEEGESVVRAGVIQDGGYHYCICLCVPQSDAREAEELFGQIFRTAVLTDTGS